MSKSRKRKEPNYGVLRQEMAMLSDATPEQQHKIIEGMTVERLACLDAEFEQWAHKNQLPPDGEGWRTWLMMAGRGFGKTRAGAEWIYRLGNSRPGCRIALVGATIAEARSIMVEGVSGLLSVARRHRRNLKWEPSLGRLRWPNGSEAQLFSGDNADGLRGAEHHFAWADELAKWGHAEEAWMNLQMGLRGGHRARALITTTPRPLALLERIQADKHTVTTPGRTSDNINLDERFVEIMTATYGGTRVGAQELDGVLLKDVEGALWTREICQRSRVTPFDFAQDERRFDRVVVGVDPPDGLDCIGVVLSTFDIPAELERSDYSLRSADVGALNEGLLRHFRRLRPKQMLPGDVLVLQPAPQRLHLAVRTSLGFVHAHANLRQVVETPGLPEWPLLGVYRRRGAR